RVTEEITDAVRIPYADIPGFPRAAVAGHAGALVAGIVAGLDVVALSGRFHLYEGRAASDIAFPLRALAALGVDLLVVTNAAGAVRADLRPGDLMVISDHINLMLGFPLLGPDLVRGERFLDLSAP